MLCPYCHKTFKLPQEAINAARSYNTEHFVLLHQACDNLVYVEVEQVVKLQSVEKSNPTIKRECDDFGNRPKIKKEAVPKSAPCAMCSSPARSVTSSAGGTEMHRIACRDCTNSTGWMLDAVAVTKLWNDTQAYLTQHKLGMKK